MSPIFTYAADLYREMRQEFELSVEAAYEAAEEGTGGAMLNKRGRAEGIDAYSLMTGPWRRVEAYGTPELIEWCETNGRPSVARFEREWFANWLGEVPLPDAVELVMPDYDPDSPEYREAERRFNEARTMSPVPYVVLPPVTRVQFKLDAPDYWGATEYYPALAIGHIVGVETVNGENPMYTVRVEGGVLDGKTFAAKPDAFVVQP